MSFVTTHTHNPATHKVVPKDAVVVDLAAASSHGIADTALANILSALRNGSRACRNLADQIEAQMKPPRIPEPGLWGVVEAVLHGDEKRARLRYVRTSGVNWLCVGGAQRTWDELIDPVLVRPGIEDGAS